MTKSAARALHLKDPTDPRAALAFVVAFASLNLLELDPPSLLALTKGLQRFVHRDNPATWKGSIAADATLEVLQAAARRILTDVAQRRPVRIAGDLLLSFYWVRRGDTVGAFVLGRDDHVFLYQLVRVLDATGTDKVLQCPATYKRKGQPDEVCGRLFMKSTTGKYCSMRCEKRMTTRRNRE